jgi:hypothetical protein
MDSDTMTHEDLAEKAKAALAEASAPPSGTEYVEIDFFDTAEDTKQVFLPGSKTQYVVITALREGQKKKYQNLTNRDMVLERASGNARMKTAPGDERHLLLKMAIVDFHLLRGGEELRYNDKNLAIFLDVAPPKVIEEIEREIHLKNPWLLADMSVEDIDKEIERLTEMRETKLKEDEGNADSAK